MYSTHSCASQCAPSKVVILTYRTPFLVWKRLYGQRVYGSDNIHLAVIKIGMLLMHPCRESFPHCFEMCCDAWQILFTQFAGKKGTSSR